MLPNTIYSVIESGVFFRIALGLESRQPLPIKRVTRSTFSQYGLIRAVLVAIPTLTMSHCFSTELSSER